MASRHTVYHSNFAVAVCIFTNLIGQISSQQFALPPFDVEGVVGNDVTIYCQVEVDVSEDTASDIYWGLPGDQGAIGPNRNRNRNFDRHSFSGDQEKGYYNLRIANATPQDDGAYTCIIVNTVTSTGAEETSEASATLTVTEGGVRNTTMECAGFADGARFEFNDTDQLPDYDCTATGGVPLAGGGDIRWYLYRRNNTYVEIPGVLTVNPSISVTSTIDSAATRLTGEDDNSYLFCSAGPVDRSLASCRIPLVPSRIRVRYQPLVRILPSEVEVGMFETYDLDIKCLADSNPPLEDFPMFEFDPDLEVVDNTSISGDDSNVENRKFTRTRISITADDIGKLINCTATNGLGTTTVVVEIKSLGGLPVWLLCAIILGGGILLLLAVLIAIICCCKCDLEQEGKRSERRRRTMGDGKANNNYVDDELGDIDLHTYDQAPAMMPPPESPVDSADSESDAGSAAMVNDFKIEEPEEDHRRVSIGSDEGGVKNSVYEEDGMEFTEEEDPKKADYTQVAMTDDTEGEDLELDELSRGTSPSLNELIE